MGGGSLGRVAGTGGARPGDAVMSGTSLPFSYNKLRQKLILTNVKFHESNLRLPRPKNFEVAFCAFTDTDYAKDVQLNVGIGT